jgi:hypothetical protein
MTCCASLTFRFLQRKHACCTCFRFMGSPAASWPTNLTACGVPDLLPTMSAAGCNVQLRNFEFLLAFWRCLSRPGAAVLPGRYATASRFSRNGEFGAKSVGSGAGVSLSGYSAWRRPRDFHRDKETHDQSSPVMHQGIHLKVTLPIHAHLPDSSDLWSRPGATP